MRKVIQIRSRRSVSASRAASVFLAVLLITGCGDEPSRPSLPTLHVGGRDREVSEVVRQLLSQQQAATEDVVAPLVGARDPDTLKLIDMLREAVFLQLNEGWPTLEPGHFRREERCCSEEELAWPRGVEVQVDVLALSNAEAKSLGATGKLRPLKGSRAECLALAQHDNRVRATCDPIVIRSGETARLRLEWTLSRRVEDDCVDVSSGSQIFLRATASEERGPWFLDLYSHSGGPTNKATAEGREGPFHPASRAEYCIRGPAANRVAVDEKVQSWILSLRETWLSAPPRQLVLTTRVVETD